MLKVFYYCRLTVSLGLRLWVAGLCCRATVSSTAGTRPRWWRSWGTSATTPTTTSPSSTPTSSTLIRYTTQPSIGTVYGWSDLALFCNFRNWTHCCWSLIWYICMNSSPQNQQIWLHVCASQTPWQSFHFPKITGTLKIICFFQIPSVYFYEPKRKFEDKISLNIFR